MKKLEAWLQGQEYNLTKEDGRSLEEVNYLIRKQEQLEEKLQLYEEKFEELRKTTKVRVVKLTITLLCVPVLFGL